VSDNEKLKGYATIVFDDCFVVRDLKIIQGSAGLLSPCRQEDEGRNVQDTAHPWTRDRG